MSIEKVLYRAHAKATGGVTAVRRCPKAAST